MRLTVHELASLEKKKDNDDFRFFQICFLGFYKPELKSEDILVLRRVRAFRMLEVRGKAKGIM